MNLNDLRNEKANKLEEAQNLIKTARAEGRELTEDEATKVNSLKEEVKNLQNKIETEESYEDILKMNASKNFISSEEKKKNSTYSINKAIIETGERALSGYEKEMHQKGFGEAIKMGVTNPRGTLIPSELIRKNDLEAGTDTKGKETVPTVIRGFVDEAVTQTVLDRAGATYLTGLTSNIQIPTGNAATAYWEGEKTTAKDAGLEMDKITLTPHRLAAKTYLTNQFLMQSTLAGEQYVIRKLRDAVARKVDKTGIAGTGQGNVPKGLINTAGIQLVDSDGTVDFDLVLEMEELLANYDLLRDSSVFLTTPGSKRKLKGTKIDTGSGQMVWDKDNTINGYRAFASTHVPSDLVADSGTAGGTSSAIIMGDFSELIVAQFGPIGIVVDPFTLAEEAEKRVIIDSYWDYGVTQPKAFAVALDA